MNASGFDDLDLTVSEIRARAAAKRALTLETQREYRRRNAERLREIERLRKLSADRARGKR